jgi:hypothetical protein
VSQDGYTASEALAALAILGLTVGGLSTSISLIGTEQLKAQGFSRQSALQRSANARLERLLQPEAPFRSDESQHLVGDDQGFEFTCGNARCSARLRGDTLVTRDRSGIEREQRLPKAQNPRITYLGSYSQVDAWPPAAQPAPAPSWQALRAVMIKDGDGVSARPLALARLWQQQRADCEYDIVVQDCRGAGS